MTNRTASETIINLLGKQYAKNNPKPNAMTQLPFPERFLRITLRPFVMSAIIFMRKSTEQSPTLFASDCGNKPLTALLLPSANIIRKAAAKRYCHVFMILSSSYIRM